MSLCAKHLRSSGSPASSVLAHRHAQSTECCLKLFDGGRVLLEPTCSFELCDEGVTPSQEHEELHVLLGKLGGKLSTGCNEGEEDL